MARLIDADKRIAEIKKLYCDGCDNYGGSKCRACWTDDAMCLIDDAPTVDAVEVVRCRDCKHWDSETWFCDNHSTFGHHGFEWNMFSEEDFCSYGERKDDDGNG